MPTPAAVGYHDVDPSEGKTMETPERTSEEQRASGAKRPEGAAEPHYIETASATTNPDNANSGSKPLLIAGAGFLVLLLLSLALGSCVSGIADAVVTRNRVYGGSGYTTIGTRGNGLDGLDDINDLDDLDRILEDLDVDLSTNGRRPTGDSYLY